MTDQTQNWIDTATAAEILDMSQRGVRKMCADGRLKAKKFGSDWRIPRSAVQPDN
jgi:excisionase family DNA binding protein